jgi:ATP-dependent Clp endopeptidase proteolytic subunit ClpP
MSEENQEIRSKREIEVDIALKEAEARKTEADARNVEAMIRKNELDADKASIELEVKKMDLVTKQEKQAKDKATDEENFLYRFGTEVGGTSVSSCMKRLTEWHRINPKCDIELVFSSPGGSIIDGFELFDFIQHLRNEGHRVTTGTLGYAASMAGILLQAGDTRWIGQQAWMMIHRAAFGAYGKTFEIEDEVKFVKRMEERILDIFTSRSDLTRNKIKRNWERKDWWISAEEAVELKLVDEVRAILPEHSSNKKKRRKRK